MGDLLAWPVKNGIFDRTLFGAIQSLHESTMSSSQKTGPGFIGFAVMFLLIFAALYGFQSTIVAGVVNAVFPHYDVIVDALPGEWLIVDKAERSEEKTDEVKPDRLGEILAAIRNNVYDPANASANALIGKRNLKSFVLQSERTMFFINPLIAFLPMYLFFAGALSFLISMYSPTSSPLGWFRAKLYRAVEEMDILLRKQFAAHDIEYDGLFEMTEFERIERIRRSTLPVVVITELNDLVRISRWMKGESNPWIPLKYFFRYRIATTYGNLIQGLVSGGAAILIFVIGLRGLKLIPAEEPSLILMALSIEFVLLFVLMLTFAGSGQEERLDRVVKELEAEQRDAIKQQTDTLHKVLTTNRTGSGDNVGGADTLADYEERRMIDELLSMMITEAEKRRSRNE